MVTMHQTSRCKCMRVELAHRFYSISALVSVCGKCGYENLHQNRVYSVLIWPHLSADPKHQRHWQKGLSYYCWSTFSLPSLGRAHCHLENELLNRESDNFFELCHSDHQRPSFCPGPRWEEWCDVAVESRKVMHVDTTCFWIMPPGLKLTCLLRMSSNQCILMYMVQVIICTYRAGMTYGTLIWCT